LTPERPRFATLRPHLGPYREKPPMTVAGLQQAYFISRYRAAKFDIALLELT
jgi:hypothetical protein